MNRNHSTFLCSMRFIRRDGDRIFLDSRDLITLLEGGKLLSVRAFSAELHRRHARLVLAFTNVKELVPGSNDAPPDRKRVTALMQRLQEIPHTFIRTPDLARNEFAAALEAFETGRPIRKIDPYVDKWWETMWRIPPRVYRRIAPQAEIALLDSLNLDQQAQILIGDLRLLGPRPDHEERVRRAMAEDRECFGTRRGTTEALTGAVKRYLEWWNLRPPKAGLAQFVKFMRSDSSVCPGWRVAFDAWEEYRCNLAAVPTANDIADLAHVELLPYVSHLTLDRAWRARCEQARDRLARNGSPVDIYQRLYPSLAAITETWQ